MRKNSAAHIIAIYLFIAGVVPLALCDPLFAQDTFAYNSHGKRDPFISLVTSDGRLIKIEQSGENLQGLNLEGIIHDNSGLSYAIVNGSIVKVGDAVGDYRVLKIEEKKVIFVQDDQVFTVDIKKEEE